jgi:hypothetical protein
MNNLTDLIVNFGNIIELSFPSWNVSHAQNLLTNSEHWVQYNPRKPNNRKGLSVTSLDGGYSGVPDLDSLREFNRVNKTRYSELDFKTQTSIVQDIPEIKVLLNAFPDHGRCHFLRLDSGGFFPPHRDNGAVTALPETFRIIVPICNFGGNNSVWIQEDKIINLDIGRTYFINTTRIHSLFSFVDMSCCFVMNVLATDLSIRTILYNLNIK